MSRSKKAPYWTEGYGSKTRRVLKRAANKRVRAKSSEDCKDLAGGAYKKLYESWNIVDFRFRDVKNPKAKRK